MILIRLMTKIKIMKTKSSFLFQSIFFPAMITIAQNQTFTTVPIQKIFAHNMSEIQCYYHDKPYTEINGDQSKVEIKNNELHASDAKIIVKTNLSNVNFFQSSNASGIYINSPLTNNNIILKSIEASNINAIVQNNKVTCITHDAASIQLSGNADSLIIDANNASSVKTQNLIANHVKIKIDNASAVSVFPDSTITGKVNTASSLKIYGNPKIINIEKLSHTSEIKYKNKLQPDSSSKEKKHDSKWYYKWKESSKYKSWQGIAFGLNGYLNQNNSIPLLPKDNYLQLDYAQSLNFQASISQINFYLYKKNIAIATGLGFEWKRFAFDQNVNLNPDSSFTYGIIDTTKIFTYKRNLLKASYLQLPLLLEFHFGKSNMINIDLGIIGQVKLSSKTRQIREKDNFKYDITRIDSYNLNPFLLKYHFSIGINYFSIYAEYSFTPLFQNNKGTLLYPFNIGIRWNIF